MDPTEIVVGTEACMSEAIILLEANRIGGALVLNESVIVTILPRLTLVKAV